MTEALRIRLLALADLDFAIEQTTREGWTSSRRWFEIHLAHDPQGCFVAESGGRRVGMVTTTAYGASGWIGNLIVLPEHRRRGLGERLMAHCLEVLRFRGVENVWLDADPMGIHIYRRLGFVDTFASLRCQRDGPFAGWPTWAQALKAGDLEEVAAFDREAFGDDRERLLRLVLKRAEAAFLVRRDGAVVGYAMMLATNVGVALSPCVAIDLLAASELLPTCLAAAGGRTVTAGLPEGNEAGCVLLESLGFVETGSSTRMVRGEQNEVGEAAHIFGIVSGAMG